MEIQFFILSMTLVIKATGAVECFWCSGVGKDRQCELTPRNVSTGPITTNCRTRYCISTKVMDAVTHEVQSFARHCDHIPHGNVCVKDSRLITCYETCTSDLCNSGNPDPSYLKTQAYSFAFLGLPGDGEAFVGLDQSEVSKYVSPSIFSSPKLKLTASKHELSPTDSNPKLKLTASKHEPSPSDSKPKLKLSASKHELSPADSNPKLKLSASKHEPSPSDSKPSLFKIVPYKSKEIRLPRNRSTIPDPASLKKWWQSSEMRQAAKYSKNVQTASSESRTTTGPEGMMTRPLLITDKQGKQIRTRKVIHLVKDKKHRGSVKNTTDAEEMLVNSKRNSNTFMRNNENSNSLRTASKVSKISSGNEGNTATTKTTTKSKMMAEIVSSKGNKNQISSNTKQQKDIQENDKLMTNSEFEASAFNTEEDISNSDKNALDSNSQSKQPYEIRGFSRKQYQKTPAPSVFGDGFTVKDLLDAYKKNDQRALDLKPEELEMILEVLMEGEDFNELKAHPITRLLELFPTVEPTHGLLETANIYSSKKDSSNRKINFSTTLGLNPTTTTSPNKQFSSESVQRSKNQKQKTKLINWYSQINKDEISVKSQSNELANQKTKSTESPKSSSMSSKQTSKVDPKLFKAGISVNPNSQTVKPLFTSKYVNSAASSEKASNKKVINALKARDELISKAGASKKNLKPSTSSSAFVNNQNKTRPAYKSSTSKSETSKQLTSKYSNKKTPSEKNSLKLSKSGQKTTLKSKNYATTSPKPNYYQRQTLPRYLIPTVSNKNIPKRRVNKIKQQTKSNKQIKSVNQPTSSASSLKRIRMEPLNARLSIGNSKLNEKMEEKMGNSDEKLATAAMLNTTSSTTNLTRQSETRLEITTSLPVLKTSKALPEVTNGELTDGEFLREVNLKLGKSKSSNAKTLRYQGSLYDKPKIDFYQPSISSLQNSLSDTREKILTSEPTPGTSQAETSTGTAQRFNTETDAQEATSKFPQPDPKENEIDANSKTTLKSATRPVEKKRNKKQKDSMTSKSTPSTTTVPTTTTSTTLKSTTTTPTATRPTSSRSTTIRPTRTTDEKTTSATHPNDVVIPSQPQSPFRKPTLSKSPFKKPPNQLDQNPPTQPNQKPPTQANQKPPTHNVRKTYETTSRSNLSWYDRTTRSPKQQIFIESKEKALRNSQRPQEEKNISANPESGSTSTTVKTTSTEPSVDNDADSMLVPHKDNLGEISMEKEIEPALKPEPYSGKDQQTKAPHQTPSIYASHHKPGRVEKLEGRKKFFSWGRENHSSCIRCETTWLVAAILVFSFLTF